MIEDKAAKRREQKAIMKEMPDLDRLKKWAEALAKQVSLNPPSATHATAGAAELLQMTDALTARIDSAAANMKGA